MDTGINQFRIRRVLAIKAREGPRGINGGSRWSHRQ